MKRIVCATDFSANARSAADVAAAIALRWRAKLVLVHVADESHAHDEASAEFRAVMRAARTRLRQEAVRLTRSGARVSTVLLHGKWAETAVVEFVEKDPPSLVVVSSVSKTAFDRWTIGSVSERISQRSPVPTLVVRSPERLLGWARQEGRLNVVVAVDFTASSDAALAWLKELRKIGPCSTTVAHIYWPPDEQRGAAPDAPLPSARLTAAVRRRLSRDLQRKIGDLGEETVEVKVESNWGRPDSALVHLASALASDLIVVGTHQWQGLKRLGHLSISRGVMRHATMAVACVPVSTAAEHGVGYRPRIRRVLVATDLSPVGDRAIPWAYSTVTAGGVVKLVHVVSPWETPSPLVPHYEPRRSTREEHHRRMSDARAKLVALVPEEAGADGITTEVEVIADRDPARAISVAAERFGADLICLGSHGRTTMAETLRGSVARTVTTHSSQPVLLVRPAQP
jgi:nucleotide-binding universal stress UspA family protein